VSEEASTGGNPSLAPNAKPRAGSFFGCLPYVLGAFILFLLAVGPMTTGIPPGKAWHNIMMQQTRIISEAMLQYANDHQGNYPSGKSSTEIFQKLLDGKYVEDGSLFYVSMKGKTPPVARQSLKPDNVCFDVTSPVDIPAPDYLPLVFSTGYKVDYKQGASAFAMVPPQNKWFGLESLIGVSSRTDTVDPSDAIVICYKGPNACTIKADSNGHISNFVSTNFNANGKTYRQLTPDGELPSH
jgi:hypothetical protein